jgi:arylsulfatase A-like enzyme
VLSALLVTAAVGCGSPAAGVVGTRQPILQGLNPEGVSIDRDWRPAVRARGNERWSGPFRPAAGATLEFAVALRCPQPPCAGAVTFQVEARHWPRRQTKLFERRLATDAPSAGWVPARIDLSAWKGREVELVFETRVEPRAAGETRPAPEAIWSEPGVVTPSSVRPPNVLLVSIDTLRADRLGSYGYARGTSPHLDALAARGIRFKHAISQAPWTTPSHMSLLTGLRPSRHGVTQAFAGFWQPGQMPGGYRSLAGSVETLAGQLRRSGYRTLALTGGGTLAAEIGFARGFDVYREGATKLDPDSGTWEILSGWLQENREAPFFLFFQTFEVHAPYTRVELATDDLNDWERRQLYDVWKEQRLWEEVGGNQVTAFQDILADLGLFRREVTSSLYDAGIRHTDAFLGRLFAELKALGIDDRTLIVVTSDHGEEFAEREPTHFYDAHCLTQYDELIHVPLIFRLPGERHAGTVVDRQVELIDVAPTVLDLLRTPVPEAIEGHSLLAHFGGRELPAEPALSEATCAGPEIKALRTRTSKYMAAFTATGGERAGIPGPLEWERLYDLSKDPAEKHDLASKSQHLAALRAEMMRRISRTGQPATAGQLSPETQEALRALGYVH